MMWKKKEIYIYCIGDYIEIIFSSSRLFSEGRSAGQNMNCLQYFQLKCRVWLIQYWEKAHAKIHCTVTMIYKVSWNWRPVCIPKIFSRASNKITYFCRDMLFNSSILPLISSSYVARTTTTPKQINKRIIMMRKKNIFTDRCQNGFSMKDHTYIG